jgi:Uma2 family endonuclease
MGDDPLPGKVQASVPRLGRFRRRDYNALPDHPRHELLWGRLYVSPSPRPAHQAVAQRLLLHFDRIAESSGGLAFIAPLDVALADHSVVQPDVLYITKARLSTVQEWIEGAPDLVVEVVSPRLAPSNRRDRRDKQMLYAVSGVRESWIVEPRARQIEFLVNAGGRFVAQLPVGGVYRSAAIPEVQIDLPDFWDTVARRFPPGFSR